MAALLGPDPTSTVFWVSLDPGLRLTSDPDDSSGKGSLRLHNLPEPLPHHTLHLALQRAGGTGSSGLEVATEKESIWGNE